MNKHEEYQEAFDYYWKIYEEHHLGMLARHYIDMLKELVDKETPKKPIKGKVIYNTFENIITHHCECGRELSLNNAYCPKCGQKLDWSDKND